RAPGGVGGPAGPRVAAGRPDGPHRRREVRLLRRGDLGRRRAHPHAAVRGQRGAEAHPRAPGDGAGPPGAVAALRPAAAARRRARRAGAVARRWRATSARGPEAGRATGGGVGVLRAGALTAVLVRAPHLAVTW